MMNGKVSLLGVVLACAVAGSAQAHPGGLNAEGCHNNRKTGGYHCHGGAVRVVRQAAPVSRPLGFASQGGSSSGAFVNCSAARAAGAAPVRRGEPGYGAHLDRDGDGIGCEPYRGR